jgi:DNA-binding response OmpR family regulator
MPSLLIVDDEPAIRALVRATLEPAGWRVSEAVDGNQGLASARREPPDVLLLDLGLPGMDGLEVCRSLHDEPETADVTVVLLSGYSDQEREQAGRNAGASGFISKPFGPAELLRRVEAASARPVVA